MKDAKFTGGTAHEIRIEGFGRIPKCRFKLYESGELYVRNEDVEVTSHISRAVIVHRNEVALKRKKGALRYGAEETNQTPSTVRDSSKENASSGTSGTSGEQDTNKQSTTVATTTGNASS